MKISILIGAAVSVMIAAMLLPKRTGGEVHCYIDDTLSFRAVLIDRLHCEAGTCKITFPDDNPLYYQLAEREFCQRIAQ